MNLSFTKVGTFFKRFHSLLFFLLVSVSLFLAIFVLITTVSKSSDISSTTGTSVNSGFDEATIRRVEAASDLPRPGARRSPFTE